MKKLWLFPIIAVFHHSVHAADVSVNYTDNNGSQQSVSAVLTEPAASSANGKRPAVVILHSRAGYSAGATSQYAELFSAKGAITLEPKMFDARPDNPMGYLAQLHAELDMLAGRVDVDPARIYVMGLSYGASLAVYAATTWSAERFGKSGKKFAKFAALYPTCFFHEGIVARDSKISARIKNFGFPEDFHDRWQDAPVRIFQGADDRYDEDPKACEKFVQSIPDRSAQSRFQVTVWPGATHAWDRQENKSIFDPLACRFKGCDATYAYNADVAEKTKTELLSFFGFGK